MLQTQQLDNYNTISSTDFFKDIDGKIVSKFLENSSIRRRKRKEQIFESSNSNSRGLFIVLEGSVKLTKRDSKNNDVILNILMKNDVINTDQIDPSFKLTAMSPTELLFIPHNSYYDTIINNPELALRIKDNLCKQLNSAYKSRFLQGCSLKKRIANLMLDLLERNADKNSTVLPMPITRQEIAGALNVTVESVIRVMSAWTQNNIISSNKQEIQILDLEILNMIANENH